MVIFLLSELKRRKKEKQNKRKTMFLAYEYMFYRLWCLAHIFKLLFSICTYYQPVGICHQHIFHNTLFCHHLHPSYLFLSHFFLSPPQQLDLPLVFWRLFPSFWVYFFLLFIYLPNHSSMSWMWHKVSFFKWDRAGFRGGGSVQSNLKDSDCPTIYP